MKALTLWRPWPWAILHGGKRIENRSWAPPASIVGQVIALHAGKRWDDDGALTIALRSRCMPDDEADHPLGIVGVARVSGFVTQSDDPWFVGPCGWTLDSVVALPQPIPVQGAQGLWWLSPEIAAVVEAHTR